MMDSASPTPIVNPERSTAVVAQDPCRIARQCFLRHGQPLQATPELLAHLAAESEKLETATPWEIVQWAVDNYFPKLTMATAFGPEGCVIIHMLGQDRAASSRFQSRHRISIQGNARSA